MTSNFKWTAAVPQRRPRNKQMPKVEAIKLAHNPKVRQPKAPFHGLPGSSISIGPSGVGKSVVLIRTLTDKDKLGGLFDRYEFFSPNIFQDPQYEYLIEYVISRTGQKKEDFCHEEFDQDFIRKIMEDQKKSNTYLRKIGAKRLLSCALIIDDFGDNASVVKASSSVVNSLFTRGRHLMISCFLLLQRFRLASNTIRFNAMSILVHRLNSQLDLEALAEEFAAVTNGKNNFFQIYRRAIEQPHGFLDISTGSEPRFFSSFHSEFRIRDAEDEDSARPSADKNEPT
jgi:hypothetical protein